MRPIIIFIVSISSIGIAHGQTHKSKKVSMYGIVRHQITAGEQGQYLFVDGAHVSIAAEGDTIKATTNHRGEFIARQIPSGSALNIEITHLGYKTHQETIMAETKDIILNVNMEDKFHELDELVVNATIPLFTMRGDTVVYNAQAVKTMEGDELIEILRQMPGVVVHESGGIEIHGEHLSKAYVNGKLIFGDDVRDVLYNLLAK